MIFIVGLMIVTLRPPPVVHAGAMRTTSPVSVILDGFTLASWTAESMWNQTRLSLVQHLNEFCRRDARCDAEYGIANVHLLRSAQYGPSSIRLNVTADEPILSALHPSSYNYTGLLTAALFQAKIDVERVHDNQRSPVARQPTNVHRLICLLLAISAATVVFTLTVLFFQRVRHHRYSQLLKTTAETH